MLGPYYETICGIRTGYSRGKSSRDDLNFFIVANPDGVGRRVLRHHFHFHFAPFLGHRLPVHAYRPCYRVYIHLKRSRRQFCLCHARSLRLTAAIHDIFFSSSPSFISRSSKHTHLPATPLDSAYSALPPFPSSHSMHIL